jgi:type I restriction enzyme S subunit
MRSSHCWPVVRLGDVVTHRKEFIQIDDLVTYKRCRVQLHAQGVVLRDEIAGAQIKTKTQQVCRADEFLVAEIDAKMGGFGIVPPSLEGAVVSSHYFLFVPRRDRLDPTFLHYYSQTPSFKDQVSARGSTNYAAIRPANVMSYTIPLPPVDEQRRIVTRVDSAVEKLTEAQALSTQCDASSARLLLATYHTIADKAPRRRLGDIAPLTRRPASVDPASEYPQVSVRSFGKGTFHNPPLQGSEITWQKPFLVRNGDVLVSNIKAWKAQSLSPARTMTGGTVRTGISHSCRLMVRQQRVFFASSCCRLKGFTRLARPLLAVPIGIER